MGGRDVSGSCHRQEGREETAAQQDAKMAADAGKEAEAERATEAAGATETVQAAGVEMVVLTLLMLFLVAMLSVVLCRSGVETVASTAEQAAGETALGQHSRAGSRGDSSQHSRW